jgi:hypothetical protein
MKCTMLSTITLAILAIATAVAASQTTAVGQEQAPDRIRSASGW